MLEGGATFATGRVGKAFSLDGVSAYVQVEHDPSLMLTNSITIEAWFRTASPGQAILYKHGASGDRSYGLQLFGTKADFFVVSGGTTQNHLGTSDVNDDVWHHIAGVFDGSGSRHELYVDGVLENAAAPSYSSIDSSTVPVWIGAGAGTTSTAPDVAFFSGAIDEVSIYSRALSAAEIEALFDAGRAGKCKRVTLCHKPGTPAEKVLVIPIRALSGHLGHGDTMGPCQ
jgi:hypothetical protein